MDDEKAEKVSLTAEQVRAARALLRIEQSELAEASGVSLPSIKRLELTRGQLTGYESTITAIKQALEKAGVQFLADGEVAAGGGAGVRLKKRAKAKK